MKQLKKSFSVTWRGKNFILEMNPCTNMKELGDKLQELTNVKADTMRLIVPTNKSSKLFYPFSDEHSYISLETASIIEGKSIRMMGVPENEVDEILQNSRTDFRIAGFDEEEDRMRRRLLDGRSSAPKLPQGTYIFSEFRTLHIPGLELNPPASEALKLMHRLAADPGIVAIMNKHHWRVGIMTEMAPVGYVGVSPKCILGFNKNHGEEISLRLRTDDLNGFRKYESIKKTLLHELAHMVYSEHDASFYALDKQLNEEAAALDWTKSKGHTLGEVRHSLGSEDFANHMSSSQKLGGSAPGFASARASSVHAASHRFASTSTNSFTVPDRHEEPDPDDSGFTICRERDCVDTRGKAETINTDTGIIQKIVDICDSHHNVVEPDPDDTECGEAMLSEPYMGSGRSEVTIEPCANDLEVTIVPGLITEAIEEHVSNNFPLEEGIVVEPDNSGVTRSMVYLNKPKVITHEPDPDDSGKNDMQYNHHLRLDHNDDLVSEATRSHLQVKSSSTEPDPDDLLTSGVVQSEPDPDNNTMEITKTMSKGHADEPDPDDKELQIIQDPVTAICRRFQSSIDMLSSELNPSAAASVVQTIIKIIRNVIEHPNEVKFRKLRKANPIIQRNIASYRAAMEIVQLIGFSEDVVFDERGKADNYLILKRNDPGLLWLAKSSLESSNLSRHLVQ